MKRLFAILAVLALLGFVAAGCGTSTGPSGGGGDISAGAGTQGQDAQDQPEASGLKNGAYTAAHNVCSLYPLSQLAQQNGLPANATAKQVATKISQGETNAADRKSAYQGCLAGLGTG